MDEQSRRYRVYARAHDREPGDMLEHDRTQYDGGVMTGFILWSNQHIRMWCEENRKRRDTLRTPAEHDDFDAWLEALYPP